MRDLVCANPLVELVRSSSWKTPKGEVLEEAPKEVVDHRQKLSNAQSLLQSGQNEQAVGEFLKTVVGADVFATLPELTRSVTMQNVRTLKPMLRTFFESMEFDCDAARSMRVPTLLIKGELSPEISHRIASRLNSSFPNAELFPLAGASHGLQIEKPTEFNQAVQQFIARC